MNRLKSMPEREKFQHAFEMVRLYHKHVLPFVEKHLGYAEMHNLRSVWQAAIVPMHEKDPDTEKYNHAYSNWLWMARCSHDLLSERLSAEALSQYKSLLVRIKEQQLDNPNLFFLCKFKAHSMLAKNLLYEMQWLTPLKLANQGKEEVTCTIHACKIVQTPGTERVCQMDCQSVGTAFALKVYHLKRVTFPASHGCKIILTPTTA
jgi:hypothetical protein